jgi:hypothetical protein
MAAARELHAARRRRRMGDVAWGDLAYRVYTTALAGLVLTVFASGLVGDDRLDAAGAADVASLGPVWAGLALGVALLTGVRSGVRSGPLALEAADVHHLLLSPLDRGRVLRTPAVSMVAYGTAALAAVGALVGELLSQRLPGSGAAWIASGALFAVLLSILGFGAAMFTASRTVRRPVPELLALALLTWSVLDVFGIGPTAPLTWLGRLLFWPLEFTPVPIAGLAVAFALCAAGVLLVGGLSIEAARRRTQLVGQLRFAVTQQDLRSVLLLRRQLAAERPRSRSLVRHLPMALGRRAPVLTRDLQSLLRWPTVRIVRVLVLVVGAALALRGVYGGTTPLILVAGVLTYVAALDAIEPLAQEVDHPTMLASYPIPSGQVLQRHLVAPVLVMLLTGAVSVAVAWAVAPDVQVLQVGAVTLVSGALGAVAGASISVVSEVGIDTGEAAMYSPEVAGPRVVIRTLWPPLVAVIGLTPVLVAQRAARTGAEVLPVASFVALASVVLCGIVFTWVRYRADIHGAIAASMRGERA